MDGSIWRDIVAMLLAVLWFFLRQRDERQQRSIDILFKRRDEDAKELQDLKLHLAKTHYDKSELDTKFEKLETAITDGMRDLSSKFDRLSEILVSHVSNDGK